MVTAKTIQEGANMAGNIRIQLWLLVIVVLITVILLIYQHVDYFYVTENEIKLYKRSPREDLDHLGITRPCIHQGNILLQK